MLWATLVTCFQLPSMCSIRCNHQTDSSSPTVELLNQICAAVDAALDSASTDDTLEAPTADETLESPTTDETLKSASENDALHSASTAEALDGIESNIKAKEVSWASLAEKASATWCVVSPGMTILYEQMHGFCSCLGMYIYICIYL